MLALNSATCLGHPAIPRRSAPLESSLNTLPDRRFWLVVLLTVLLAAALRWPALSTDFWLDEIWSLGFAQHEAVTSVRGIFTHPDLNHDNNHLLNTVWLYWVGNPEGWMAYRMLTFVCGLLAVLVAMLIGRRRSPLNGTISGVLFAFSFMMVVYSTEARGYGPVILWALCGFLVLEQYLKRPSMPTAGAFWCCAVLGFLSHFAFVHFYLGALHWSTHRLVHDNTSWWGRARLWAWLHVTPLLFVVTLYVGRIRSMQIGGGDPAPWSRVVDEALAWTTGYPVAAIPVVIGLVLVAAAVIWDARSLEREGSDEWLLYLGVIVLAPALTLLLLSPSVLYARYFILPLTFLLLVLARILERVATGSRRGAVVAALSVMAFAGLHMRHLLPFWQYGRGLHRQAVVDMAQATAGRELRVGIDHPLRTPMLLRYYQRYLPEAEETRTIRLSTMQDLVEGTGSRERVDWIIRHTQEYDPEAPEVLRLTAGTYTLFRHYPYYGPSGMHWFVYRLDE